MKKIIEQRKILFSKADWLLVSKLIEKKKISFSETSVLSEEDILKVKDVVKRRKSLISRMKKNSDGLIENEVDKILIENGLRKICLKRKVDDVLNEKNLYQVLTDEKLYEPLLKVLVQDENDKVIEKGFDGVLVDSGLDKFLVKEDLEKIVVKGELNDSIQLDLLKNYQLIKNSLSCLNEVENKILNKVKNDMGKSILNLDRWWDYQSFFLKDEPENEELKTVNFNDFVELFFAQGIFTVDTENQFIFTNINDNKDSRLHFYEIKFGMNSPNKDESDKFIDEYAVRYLVLLKERLEKINLTLNDSENPIGSDLKEYLEVAKKEIENSIQVLTEMSEDQD